MLCTDDSDPDTLIYEGHIDKLVRKGYEKGLDIYNLIRAAAINPVEHYRLNVGLVRKGDPADFIIVDNLKAFNVLSTFIDGKNVYDNGKILFPLEKAPVKNVFKRNKISIKDLKLAFPAELKSIKSAETKNTEIKQLKQKKLEIMGNGQK